MKLFTLLILVLTLNHCASLQSVSITQIPKERNQPIQAEVSDWGLFGIHFDNDFVDHLSLKLKEKCQNGKVTGILTKYESYFYFFVIKRKAISTGYCINKG